MRFPSPEDYPTLVNPRPLRQRLKRCVDRVLEHGMADVAETLLECDRLLHDLQISDNVCMVAGQVARLRPENSEKQGRVWFADIVFIRDLKHKEGRYRSKHVRVMMTEACAESAQQVREGDFIVCLGMLYARLPRMDTSKIEVICWHVEIVRTARQNQEPP